MISDGAGCGTSQCANGRTCPLGRQCPSDDECEDCAPGTVRIELGRLVALFIVQPHYMYTAAPDLFTLGWLYLCS